MKNEVQFILELFVKNIVVSTLGFSEKEIFSSLENIVKTSILLEEYIDFMLEKKAFSKELASEIDLAWAEKIENQKF